MASPTFTGLITSPELSLTNTTQATSSTTGAFLLPGIGMGDGKIFTNSVNLPGGGSIIGSSDANYALIWTDIPNVQMKDVFFRWGYFGTNNSGSGKQVIYEFGQGNGGGNYIFQAASHNTTNVMSFNVAAQNIQFFNLPTSATGLNPGQLYKDPVSKTIRYA
ncbi:MAG: hypothetical protein ACRC8A_13270 [Microcoleaceae cyanobacterium]